MISTVAVVLTGITFVMARVYAGQAANADDARVVRWLKDKEIASREFAKVGVFVVPCVSVPADVGLFVGRSEANAFAAVAALSVLSAVGVAASALALHRYPSLKPNVDFWQRQSSIEFHSLSHRSGAVFWAIVGLLLLIAALAVIALVLTASA